MKGSMTYNVYGVEIRASLVHNRGIKSDVYFSHELHYVDRMELETKGIPVYFDLPTGLRYLTVDTALLRPNTDSMSDCIPKCECGAKAVGASRHSSYCPCN